jgi:hypothetical protein
MPAAAAPGGTLWTATYDGPASGPDTPRGIVVDPNLYRVYVVGTTGNDSEADIVTIAYDLNTGDKIWARRYDGPAHGGDLAVAIAYDPVSGGVTMTGMSESVAGTGRIDAVTISYLSDGSRRWTRRASTIGTDGPIGLVVDGGSTYVLLNGLHGRLVAYDSTGTRLWATQVTTQNLVRLVGLQDIGGYLMAVGTISVNGGTAIVATTFNSSGTPVWTRRFGGPAHDALASDAAGGGTIFHVTGSYTDGGIRKITTILYEPHDGFRFWRRSIAPQPGGSLDPAARIAVSADGASIAVAVTSTRNGVRTFLTRQYNGDGTIAWTARENGTNDSGDVLDAAIGPDANVYVAGQGTNTGGSKGPLTVAYGSTGPPSAFEASIAPTNMDDAALAIAPISGAILVASRVAGDIRVDAYASY